MCPNVATSFVSVLKQVRNRLQSAKDELSAANAVMGSIVAALEDHERAVRVDVEHKLADRGVDGARIKAFQSLSSQASLLASYEANLAQMRVPSVTTQSARSRLLLAERRGLIDQQRTAFDRVTAAVHTGFDGRISARRIDDGNREPLDRFLRVLNQRGVTRWWNDLERQGQAGAARPAHGLGEGPVGRRSR